MQFEALTKIIEDATVKGCRFVSLTYKAKGTGELAQHTLLLGAKLENAYKKDIAKLQGLELVGIDNVARNELVESYTESLEKGIGNNSQYTQKGMHDTLAKGLRVFKDKEVCQIYGYSIRKSVIEAGTYKKVNSSEKTIAKNKLRKSLRNGKFRTFNVEAANLQVAKIDGSTLILA